MRPITVTWDNLTDGSDSVAVVSDVDTTLVAVVTNINTLVTTDPQFVYNVAKAPTSRTQLKSVIAFIPTATTVQISPNFPVLAGERVFVSSATTGNVVLYFNP